MQRRVAVAVVGVDVGAASKEQPNDVGIRETSDGGEERRFVDARQRSPRRFVVVGAGGVQETAVCPQRHELTNAAVGHLAETLVLVGGPPRTANAKNGGEQVERCTDVLGEHISQQDDVR